jgi:hypothetical protein
MELSPSWEAAYCAAIQEIPSNFKEPEGSSPYSQEPSTGPYPEPFNPVHTIPSYLSDFWVLYQRYVSNGFLELHYTAIIIIL